MKRIGPGAAAGSWIGGRAGAIGAVGTACIVLVLAGCSAGPKPSAASTPFQPPPLATSAPMPGIAKPAGTDVDPVACKATKAALIADQEKSAKDGSDQARMGADLKAAASTLRTQAKDTKNAQLKDTLTAMAVGYDNLAHDILAGTFAAAAAGQVQTAGAELDKLCPQESV